MAWEWIKRLAGRRALQRRLDGLSNEIGQLRTLIETMRVEHDPAPAREQATAAMRQASHAGDQATLAREELALVRSAIADGAADAAHVRDEVRAIAADLGGLIEKASTIDRIAAAQGDFAASREAAVRSIDALGLAIDKVGKQNAIEHAELRQADLALAERLETVRRSALRDHPR